MVSASAGERAQYVSIPPAHAAPAVQEAVDPQEGDLHPISELRLRESRRPEELPQEHLSGVGGRWVETLTMWSIATARGRRDGRMGQPRLFSSNGAPSP